MMENNPAPGGVPLSELELLHSLELAIANLWWVSEQDAPLEMLYWPDGANFPESYLAQQKGFDPQAKVQIVDFAEFMAPALKAESWHDEAEQNTVQSYQLVVKLMQENLQELRVYLVGKVEQDAFFVGTTTKGEIMGLRTKIVAT